MKKITLTLLSALLTKTLALATGPISGTGGGEDIGPEFVAIAKTLPTLIEMKGVNLFPEINLTDLRKFLGVGETKTNDLERKPSFTTKTENNLTYMGESKIFRFNRKDMTITIDPEKFVELKMNNHKLLEPLIFHEILGLFVVFTISLKLGTSPTGPDITLCG